MNYMQALGSGFAELSHPSVIGVIVGGTVIGVVGGVVPGLGGLALLAMLLPFLYNVSPVLALGLLLAVSGSGFYAASTTAILINTPGQPEAAATCLDGYAMTKKGLVGRALGVSAASTTYGGWIGVIGILGAIPLMSKLVDVFQPPDYFFLTILAVALIGQLQSGSPTKGILSGLLGFLLSFVGAAASTGTLRFTFGSLGLYSGVNIAATAIGFFAVSQMFLLVEAKSKNEYAQFRISSEVWRDVRSGIMDAVHHGWLATRCAVIGVICGVIPGIGSTAANFISYGYAMNSSKDPRRFGTGIPEGIVAPEASSISKEAGSLIPTIALGVPNGPAMAIVLAAFSIVGLSPGPAMMSQHLPLVFWMAIALAVTSVLASVIGLGLAPVLAKIAAIPGSTLVPFILVLASIGIFATTTSFTQVIIMMVMGGVGLVFRRYNYSLPAIIVGVVLGTTAENNLLLTQQTWQWRFIERPLTDAFILAIIAVIIFGSRRRRSRSASSIETPDGLIAGETSTRSLARGELVVDVCWLVGSVAYVIIGSRYPAPANLAPVVLGSAAIAVSLFQLVGFFVPRLRRVTHGSSEGMSAFSAMSGPSGKPNPEIDTGSGSSNPEAAMVLMGAEREQEQGGALSVLEEIELAEEIRESEPSRDIPGGEPTASKGSARVQMLGVLAGGGLLLAIYLFGYQIGAPLWVAAYLFVIKRWKPIACIAGGGVIAGTFYILSIVLTSVVFPTGIL